MKNFIIDTNVLLQDPESIFSFEEHTVNIPIGVIEELDTFKKADGELGRNSRAVSRNLDLYRAKGDLRKGVSIGDDREGKIRIVYNGNLGTYQKEKNVDFHVLHMADVIMRDEPDNECVVISRDINVRLKANALGIMAEDYETGMVKSDDLDSGNSEVKVGRDTYALLFQKDRCPIEDVFDDDEIPFANHYVLISGPDKSQKNINAKVNADRTMLEKIDTCPSEVRIKPINKEQAFVMDALLDPDVYLICIVGRAGTGKTLLATAAGEYMVEQLDEYEKMLISRPVQPMGRDIGFLPGDINEKLDPWMQPIYDALEIIYLNKKNESKGKKLSGKKIAELSDKIFIEPLTYIRGRNIHNQYVIVDEAQNLTLLELKTIITRAGENTKIVLTGDIDQIDNPYLDSRTNGLSLVLEAFKDSKHASHIVMKDGVRSILSEEAAQRL